jgi:NitT/TauT family transport system permease protein
MSDKLKQVVPALVALALLVVAWEVLARAFKVPQFIVPLPSAVWYEFQAKWPHLPRHTWFTVAIVFASFAVSAVLGVALGIAVVFSRFLNNVFMPLILALQVVPKIAIAPLVLIWFGFGVAGKIAIALTVAFFPVLVNTISGLQSAEPEILDLARSLHASKGQIFRKILFPNALPYIFTGLKISITLSVVGGIIAEFMSGNVGLGHVMMQAQFEINTPLMFVSLAFLAVIGLLSYGLIVLLERLCVPWDVKQAGQEALELVEARM